MPLGLAMQVVEHELRRCEQVMHCDSTFLVESASMLHTPRFEVMQHLVWCA
jgi:hypothetical protein